MKLKLGRVFFGIGMWLLGSSLLGMMLKKEPLSTTYIVCVGVVFLMISGLMDEW